MMNNKKAPPPGSDEESDEESEDDDEDQDAQPAPEEVEADQQPQAVPAVVSGVLGASIYEETEDRDKEETSQTSQVLETGRRGSGEPGHTHRPRHDATDAGPTKNSVDFTRNGRNGGRRTRRRLYGRQTLPPPRKGLRRLGVRHEPAAHDGRRRHGRVPRSKKVQ